MAPKIVDKAQRKREIALQALEIFAKSGFEAASMSQIAAGVGVGKGTLYDYFASKDALIYEALVAWTDQMIIGLEHFMAQVESPEEKLRTMARMSVEMLEQDPQIMQMSIAAMQVLLKPENLEQFHFVKDAFARMRKDVVGIMLQGVSQGIFLPTLAEHAEKMAINLLAALDGVGMHYYMSGKDFDIYEQMDFTLDQFFARWRKERSPSEAKAEGVEL